MIFQKFFGDTEDNGKKKIILFHNLPVVNAFLEAESEATGAGQNVVIEDALADRYLNDDKTIAETVVRYVTSPTYEQDVTFDICSRLAGQPAKANESVLPLIDFVSASQRHLDNHVSEKDTLLNHFSQNCAWLATLLEPVAEDYEVCVIKDLGDCDNLSRVAETINGGITLSLLLDYIVRYADTPVGKDKHKLLQDTTPYRIICDICGFPTWQKRSGDKYKFTRIVKDIRFN